ncbi:MAG: hypothetical protein A2X49_04340 [Lentisphaerae bacterium GWF2_52_8]|nr:MAG: hypothetical protein A2X49_04340 [Lentisphaerae bacterium GWF2_52_8]
MKIICPGCKQPRMLPRIEEGRRIECSCGCRFQLEKSMVLEDADEPVPSQIGPCKIEGVIGMGGMGRVYRSTHPTLGLPVAVKVLHPEFASQSSFTEHFIRTARLSAKLDHPNIVRIYDCGEDKGQVYLIMEYVSGGTAQDLLDEWGCLEPGAVVEIGIAVCNALAEAEKCGIVHRDIKPDNIMRSGEGGFKLSDLGLAHRISRDEKRPAPQAQPVKSEDKTLGTPHYMAPEQAIAPEESDLRADIYSLGVTLYQLSTGQLPFSGKDHAELRRHHAEDTPAIPSDINPRIPAKLDQIILRSMAKDPAGRYQSPREMCAELECLRSKSATGDYLNAVSPQSKPGKTQEKPSSAFRPELSVSAPPKSQLLSWSMMLSLFAAVLASSLIWIWKAEPKKDARREPISKGEETPQQKITVPSQPQEETRSQNSSPLLTREKEERLANEQKIWDFALAFSERVIKEQTGYDDAISNFEAIRDSSGKFASEAVPMIAKLRELRERSAKDALTSLAEKARPLIAMHDLDGVASLYGNYDGPAAKETAAARKKVFEAAESKARALAKEREKTVEAAAEEKRRKNAEQERVRRETVDSITPLIMQNKLSEAIAMIGDASSDLALTELSGILTQARDADKHICDSLKAEIGNVLFMELDGRKQIIAIRQVKDGKIQAEINEGNSSVTLKFDVQSLSFADRYRYLDGIDKRARSLYSALEALRNKHLNIAEKYIPGTGSLLAVPLMEKLTELQTQEARAQAQAELLRICAAAGLRSVPSSAADAAAALAKIKMLKPQAEGLRDSVAAFRTRFENFASEKDCKAFLKILDDSAIETLKKEEDKQSDEKKTASKTQPRKTFKIKSGDDLYSALITCNVDYNGHGKIRLKSGFFYVDLNSAGITDISPLENLPIKTLSLNFNPGIRDLAPLHNCPIEILSIIGTGIDDLSPLLSIRLKNLSFSPTKITNIESLRALRGMSSLENISADNDPPTQSAAEFWRKYDAGAYTTAPNDSDSIPPESPEESQIFKP